ncbi:sacsin N-terminal ATP-binding-like domain-containing protein [Marinobacterium lutimaris]|uniref:Sacsin/Nov domain-containing protein n=1 Tax=Marinobacterium lutimaris TaxID=568106 RepID=A0A1H5VS08_9GAMM|nr:hypothetical protein [Marinobacterium lutimaris]SEF89806.1 hypothetical protein SAMN05444390_101816 [Marinobacterium lutimaris]
MFGFTQDPIQFINLIADNLRDRYQTGFPVLKELIQNSDDAPATELHYGLSPGLVGAIHPLLKGPGIFLINNGAFKSSDARGIRSFGQNSKAADQGSIGKFGLGMKSVFHFCEAFFFLAHDGEREYSEILNPWSGPDPDQTLHVDWNSFGVEDAALIRNHLEAVTSSLSSEADQCFILWLPLRQKAHLKQPFGEQTGAIVSEFPGDDTDLLSFMYEAELGIRIAALMPMLRHLQRVSFWTLNDAQEKLAPVFDVQLTAGGRRTSLIGAEPEERSGRREAPQILSGRTQVEKGDGRSKLEFTGLEYLDWNPRLNALHAHDLWPSSYIRDELGHSREAKDKAQPHGAVFFSRAPGSGRLITNWSVFLPLDENSASQTIRCDGNFDFRLTLHGYFFVDAGRQGVHGMKEMHEHQRDSFESEEALRRAWNHELLQSVVLPLVLPALNSFCSDLKLADKVKSNLTQALTETDLFKQFRHEITQSHSWIREITVDGARWVLKPNDKKVLRLPSTPESDSGRPWRLFPSLSQLAQQVLLVVDGAPNILSVKRNTDWDEQSLNQLLGSVEAKSLFVETTLLDYFLTFLRDTVRPFLNIGTVKQSLERLVREGLSSVGEALLGQNESRVRQVVSYLEQSRCLPVDNQLPVTLLQELLSASSNILVIPTRFWPREWKQDTGVSVDEAVPLLKALQQPLSPQSKAGKALYEGALKIAELLIKSVAPDSRSSLLRRCSELYVLRSYDCQADRVRAASPKEIDAARIEGLLFGYAQGTKLNDRLALAPLLQRVLPHDRILIISADTSKLALGIERSQPPCDGHRALHALGLKARVLADSAERMRLAGQLGKPADQIAVRGLRYLLHARDTHFDASDPLWILGDDQHPVWLKLWAQLVDEDPWNLVQEEIADHISRGVLRTISVKGIRSDSVIEELIRRGVQSIDPNGFDQEECEEILSEVQDDELWRILPFHWTVDDLPVSAQSSHVFQVPDDYALDELLLSGVTLIVPSNRAENRLRQNKLLPILDHGAFIELALEQPSSPGIWREILDRLQSLTQEGEELSLNVAKRLRSTRWLTSETGTLFSPEDVIDFDGDVGLGRILAQSPGAFVTVEHLEIELRQHPFFAEFGKGYFSIGQAGVDRLALAVEDLENYQIGNSNFNSSADVAAVARSLSSAPHLGWRVLASLDGLMGPEIDLLPMVSSMRHPMQLEAITKLLIWIADRGATDEEAVSTFNRYLKQFADSNGAAGELPRLKLLSKNEDWAESGKLVSDVVGIAKPYVLHKRQADILRHLFENRNDSIVATESSRLTDVAAEPSAAAGILRDYFQDWSGRVAPALTGALVLLCGGEDSVKSFCQDLLGQHSREWLIEKLPWRIAQGVDQGGALTWLNGFTLERALDYFSMTVRIHDTERLTVCSIIGTPASVEVEKELDSIFIGKPSYYSFGGNRGYRVDLVLRKLDVDQCSDKVLSDLLKSSMTYLLTEVYGQKGAGLDGLWGELDTADQVDIELARSLILRNIPFYLKQLGAHKHPSLISGLNRFRDEERKEQEHKGTSKEDRYRKQKEGALKELQRTIETDNSVQEAILESVRRKIQDFQYQAGSIPFELFQNADDAVQHLALIDAYPSEPGGLDVEPLPASICRFSIEADRHRVVFMHWGRAINQFGNNGFPGRERGYDRDLENILILSASDKTDDVTGKFGLGFKSVWLATNRPVLVSGRLQTEIVGGLLPVPASSTDVKPLRQRMKSLLPDSHWPGTAIALPLVGVTENEILDSFSGVAGVMVAFSRHLRRIDIVRKACPPLSVSWSEEKVPGSDTIRIGGMRHEKTDLLIMKITLPSGAMLIGVGPEGFMLLPKDIPSIWVTAPIREQERLGFAVNAMFEVDAGRSRLSASLNENPHLAQELGRQLARALGELKTAVEIHWDALVELMQLGPSASPYSFWSSLWQTLMGRLPGLPRESGTRIIAEALLCEGLKELSCKHALIPNGLRGHLSQLLSSAEIKTVLRSALHDPEILKAVSEARCFQDLINARAAVTSEVSTWLKILVPAFTSSKTQWQSESLSSLFAKLDHQKAIVANDAALLGGTFNQNVFKRWEQSNEETPSDYIADLKSAASHANSLKFISECGTEERAKVLLSCGGSDEESLRWGFAPSRYRLGGEYQGSGVEFFYWCRDKMDAPSEKLREWVLLAEDTNKRIAALHYLVEGELAREVTDSLLKSGIGGTWLAAVDEESAYLHGWSETQRSKLVYQVLKTPDQSRGAWLHFTTDARPETVPIDPLKALQNIHKWWLKAREEKLEKYGRDTYPDGRTLILHEDEFGRIDRSSWLTLLLLGGFHTMGRTKSVQHRQFVETCYRQGWWDVFTDPNHSQRFDDWMKVLDQYLDKQVDQQEYEQWMLRFPIIYKLSRYLEDYAELFVGLERYSADFDLANTLNSKADSAQQGGGISAPALARSLGIGANFVVRELIRFGLIDSQYLRKHAYVPTLKVRQLLTELGWSEPEFESQLKTSPTISSFLVGYLGEEKSCFCGDFDIPLRHVAEDWQLQQELLGRELKSVED